MYRPFLVERAFQYMKVVLCCVVFLLLKSCEVYELEFGAGLHPHHLSPKNKMT